MSSVHTPVIFYKNVTQDKLNKNYLLLNYPKFNASNTRPYSSTTNNHLRVLLLYLSLIGPKLKSFSSSRLRYNSITASFLGGLNLDLKELWSNILLLLR